MKKKILALLLIGLLALSLTVFAACDLTIDSATSSGHVHDYGSVTVPAGCEESGFTTYVCDICGHVYVGDRVDALGHTWNDGEETTPATFERAGEMTYVCTVCGKVKTEEIPQLLHAYSEDWSSDEKSHWHACTDEGYGDLKQGEAAHDWNDGETTAAATFEAAGEMTFTCTVCGKVKTEEIPQLLHAYSSDWSSDDESHWHACTDAGYETLKQGEAAHDWNDGEVTAAATFETAGVTTYTCSVCKKTRTEEIPQLVHSYSSEWSGDDESHWHACTDTGYETLKQGEAAHVWNDGEMTAAATCEAAGEITYTCTVCGKVKTEVIAAFGHNFVAGVCVRCGEADPDYNASGKKYVRVDEDGAISATGGYILFGEYPQTVKAEAVAITETIDYRGYYLGSDGAYYAKVTANPRGSGYTFTTGTTIEQGTVYYFKVEPIKWRILDEGDGTATILCEMIIDARRFDDGSNDYADSEIRAWLNENFYETAFNKLESMIINTVRVDNGVKSTMPYGETLNDGVNAYACADTYDKVWLMSEEEITRSWKFVNYASCDTSDAQRRKKTTDYAKANYAWTHTTIPTYYGNGEWWLRSPHYGDSYIPRYVSAGGNAYGADIDRVDYSHRGVVPALQITL